MDRVIFVKITTAFGRTIIRPDSSEAEIFAKLLKQSTFTESDIELIKKLGYEIKTRETVL